MSRAVTIPVENPQKDFYLLVQPWNVYALDAATFEKNGGPSSIWGKAWKKIQATSIVTAREIGEAQRVEDAKIRVSYRVYESESHVVGF